MGNEDRATRAILVIVCLLAIAQLVIAVLVQIAVHELRRVHDTSRERLKLLTRKAVRWAAPVENWPRHPFINLRLEVRVADHVPLHRSQSPAPSRKVDHL
jgi:hypothetical protein